MTKIEDTVWNHLVEHYGADHPPLSEYPQLASSRRHRLSAKPALIPLGPITRVRSRTTLALATALMVGVVAVLAVSLGGRSVGAASAQEVLARTAAAVIRSGNGILHIEARTTYTGTNLSYAISRWSEQTRPYRFWATARTARGTMAETRVGNTVTVYQSNGNQIWVGPLRHSRQIPDPLLVVIDALNLPSAFNSQIDVPDYSSIAALKTFAEILDEMSHAPGVTVNRHATLHGEPAIRIQAADRRATLYVKPGTYAPLGFTTARLSTYGETTTVFKTFATLPSGSLHMPNLTKEHPHANVPAWDRRYWNTMSPAAK